MSDPIIPDGFVPHFRKSKFTDPWEPLYSKVSANQIQIGTVLTEAHCNSRGLVHGAFLAAIADNSMGLSCVQVIKSKGIAVTGLVTVNLSLDYLGMAKVGEWIETQVQVIKTGKTFSVASCSIGGSTLPVVRANATFHVS